MSLAVEVQSLNHWTAREVLILWEVIYKERQILFHLFKLDIFCFFSYLIVLAKISNVMLNRSDERRHPYLILNLKKAIISLSWGFSGGSDSKVSVCNAGHNLQCCLQFWVRSLGQEDPLEKEMATHSSILAWKIPWTEEPGRLQSMGSQRVGHDWATLLYLSWQHFFPKTAFFRLRMLPLFLVCWDFYHKWRLKFIKNSFSMYEDDHIFFL